MTLAASAGHLNGMETLSMLTPTVSGPEGPRIEADPRRCVEPPVRIEPRMVVKSPLLPAYALAEHLDALAGLVERASDIDYLARPAARHAAPMGALVRHSVDHVLALLDRPGDSDSPGNDVMTYDIRQSDLALERSRRLAIVTLRALAARVRDMAPRTSDVPLIVETTLGWVGARARVRSSLGRELVLVLQQTMHAEAMVAALLAGLTLVHPAAETRVTEARGAS